MANVNLAALRQGDSGSAVRLLGAILAGAPINAFDEALKEKVVSFQAERGLKQDGVAGENTWNALISAEAEKRGYHAPARLNIYDFKQYDARWADKLYSSKGDKSQTVRSSGCGPTAMADIIYAVDKSVTPATMADFALSHGDRTASNGTAWSFFDHVAKAYPMLSYKRATRLSDLESCLLSGGAAVVSMGKGYWTKGGHYICVHEISGGYVCANDPASSARKRQKTDEFMKERRMCFCFWPK
ncbi:MAG: C39 family peptidase [Clostridia bacterium]|nr:C39 family peptidase [Clostridia bacterium]